MKKHQYFELYQILYHLVGTMGNGKFAYAVAKNLQKLESLITEFREINKSTEAIIEFEKQRIELCKKYATKDENGQPIIKNNVYSINEKNRIIFQKALDKLIKQHPVAENDKIHIEAKIIEWGKQEIEPLILHKITPDDLPNLTPDMVQVLDIMIGEKGLIEKPNLRIMK